MPPELLVQHAAKTAHSLEEISESVGEGGEAEADHVRRAEVRNHVHLRDEGAVDRERLRMAE